MNFFFFPKTCNRRIRINARTAADLIGDAGADPGISRINGFCRCLRPIQHQRAKLCLIGQKRVLFPLCRNKIRPSRQHFPDRADLCGYMLDAVNNHPFFIRKNQVAVLAHNLDGQRLFSHIPKVIEMFDLKMDDPFHIRLPDLYNPPVCDMLSQQHTKIRRGHRAGLICIG